MATESKLTDEQLLTEEAADAEYVKTHPPKPISELPEEQRISIIRALDDRAGEIEEGDVQFILDKLEFDSVNSRDFSDLFEPELKTFESGNIYKTLKGDIGFIMYNAHFRTIDVIASPLLKEPKYYKTASEFFKDLDIMYRGLVKLKTKLKAKLTKARKRKNG